MTIDPIRRLAVIAAGAHDPTLVEAVLDAPYAAVWKLASDLETGVPRFEPDVVSLQVIEQEGERLRVVVQARGGLEIPMNVVLRDGYCLMQSEHVSIGMAARAEGDKTRFAHFESVPGHSLPRQKLIDELQTLEKLAQASASRPGGYDRASTEPPPTAS
jgi:hypothetical protein